MSTSHTIRILFNLPPDELIFDDFTCALKLSILTQGRMYITEKNICFNANIMGIKRNVASFLSLWKYFLDSDWVS